MAITILSLQGKEILPYIEDLSHLRIVVFREYPYLYEGDMDYEKWYLHTFVDCAESVMIVALEDEKVIGASTAIPLKYALEEFQQPFKEHGFNVDTIFYYGESLLLPAYRGQGIGKIFFQEREKMARKSGYYTIAAFCAVDRAIDDPKRPRDYRTLDSFWHHQGFNKHPQLRALAPWKEMGEAEASLKPLTFWLKTL